MAAVETAMLALMKRSHTREVEKKLYHAEKKLAEAEQELVQLREELRIKTRQTEQVTQHHDALQKLDGMEGQHRIANGAVMIKWKRR